MASELIVRTPEDADALMARVRSSAERSCSWMQEQRGDPLDVLRQLKFQTVGCHPVDGHALNFIEQVNQTWTFAVAIAAAKQLLRLHPDVGGFLLAPGAHASQDLDIMSVLPGVVGAEVFAAVTPRNNGKLNKDLAKLEARAELFRFRYVFFLSPRFPGNTRHERLEKNGVEVWSVDL